MEKQVLNWAVRGVVVTSALFWCLGISPACANDGCCESPGEPSCANSCSLVQECAACGEPCNCLCCRETLTGDWLDRRSCLAQQGITLDADITQFYYGVVDGGVDQEFRYAGHGDYVMSIAGSAIGLNEGLFIKLRAEHRFGEGITSATGAYLPVNILADLPVADSENLYLTNVLFTQMLSESFGVFAGKLDTLDGDDNAFAHGRGKTQFSNIAYVVTPIGLRTVVYSTLGAGFVILNEGEPIFTFSVLNATDTTRTSGFAELFENGVALVPELRLPTELFGLPGHQLFGGSWSSRDFATLDQSPLVLLPRVPLQRQEGAWALWWNFDQYLVVDSADPTRGWGLFGRAGIADERTNPIKSFLSFGVGGSSPLVGRTADTFGVGWYYSETSDEIAPFLQNALGGLGDSQGVELYYNAQVTPWFNLTADVQVIMPARQSVDTALVTGVRGNVRF